MNLTDHTWVTLGIILGVIALAGLGFLAFVYATHREAQNRRRNGEQW